MKQKITSIDVARAAGVSQSLVSLALNPHTAKRVSQRTREHILSVSQSMGYRVNMNASSMKSSNANAIGIISAWDINSYVYAPIVSGVRSVCFDRNFALMVCSPQKKSNELYDFKEYYLQRRIDGAVVISYVGLEREGILSELDSAGIPYTCVIGSRNFADITSVDVNYIRSGELVAEHLADKGYDKVVYILKDYENNLNYAEAERLAGCRTVSEKNNMRFITYEGFIGNTASGDYYRSAKELVTNIEEHKTEGKCAVVSTSFECYSVLKAAHEAGINVPRSFGVISLDNERYNAYMMPQLTSVKQPLEEMGEEAARLLLDRLNGKNGIYKKEFMPLLSVRESA